MMPAAGLETIFLPATKTEPKEMLPVIDKPVIQWVFPKKDTLNIGVGCLYLFKIAEEYP